MWARSFIRSHKASEREIDRTRDRAELIENDHVETFIFTFSRHQTTIDNRHLPENPPTIFIVRFDSIWQIVVNATVWQKTHLFPFRVLQCLCLFVCIFVYVWGECYELWKRNGIKPHVRKARIHTHTRALKLKRYRSHWHKDLVNRDRNHLNMYLIYKYREVESIPIARKKKNCFGCNFFCSCCCCVAFVLFGFVWFLFLLCSW